MIGVQTLVSLTALALTIAIAGARGLLGGEYLASLSASSCLVIGLFASLSAALAGQIWRPFAPQRSHIDSAKSKLRLDLPSYAHHAVLVFIFVCVGLAAFTNRATTLLASSPDRLRISISEYCADEEIAAEIAAVPTIEAASMRGCALILRAYELGYAKSLGSCAPEKEVAGAPAAARAARPVCTARHRDEPFLHYAWRFAANRFGEVGDAVGGVSLGESARRFETKLGYLDTLFANHAHAIAASPRSSHHLWTNLPDPHPSSLIEKWLVPESCTSESATMQVRLDWQSESEAQSALLGHAFAHLLFDPRFGPPSGYCRDYTIHWDAPANACQQLAEDPEGFLATHGALEPVRDVLDRLRRYREARELAVDLGQSPRGDPPPPLERIVSFQCLIADSDGTGRVTATELVLGRQRLSARELRAPAWEARGASQLQVYRRLATLLAGVQYTGPVEGDSIARAAAQNATPDDLAQPGYSLAKLEIVREADPFLGAGWALELADLTEVYPFHLHLQNFIDVFRRAYRARRGRL